MTARSDQLRLSVQYSLHAKITFNINLIGKKSVGKSSLVIREIKDEFGTVPKGQNGFQFYSKVISHKTEDISIQLWDTVGQSGYNSITRNFFRKAAAILFVYDRIDNLQQDIKDLDMQINEYAPVSVKLCLVRTKIDINCVTQQQRIITQRICNANSGRKVFYHGEVSAKTNENVHKYFLQLIELMLKSYEEQQDFKEIVTPTKDSFFLDSPSSDYKWTMRSKKNCC